MTKRCAFFVAILRRRKVGYIEKYQGYEPNKGASECESRVSGSVHTKNIFYFFKIIRSFR